MYNKVVAPLVWIFSLKYFIHWINCLFFFFSVKTEDYFDSGIMEKIQDQLNAITSRSEIDINGSLSTITFHSTVSSEYKKYMY